MRIVLNRCYGGFSLSLKALEYLGFTKIVEGCHEMGLKSTDPFGPNLEEERTNPKLIECIEKLGEEAWGTHATLEIFTIPDDLDFYISDNHGFEYVHENHRVWPGRYGPEGEYIRPKKR